jgi:hypothetical protein
MQYNGGIPNVIGGGSSVSSLQPLAVHNDDLSSVSNISCLTQARKGAIYHNVPGLSLDLVPREPVQSVAKKFGAKFRCRHGGTVETPSSSRIDYYSLSCTCGDSSGIRVHRPIGGGPPYLIQISLPKKTLSAVSADVFGRHYVAITVVDTDMVAAGSVELLVLKVLEYAKAEGSIPTSYMISSYLSLCSDPQVVTLFRSLSTAAKVSVIETAIERLTLAQSRTHPWLASGEGDEIGATLQGVSEFCHRFAINSYFDGGAVNRIDSLPLESSMTAFLDHFGFDGRSQKLTYPLGDILLRRVELHFRHVPNARAEAMQCIVFVCPAHLYFLWRLLTSEDFRHMRVFYIDGKMKVIRGGRKGTVLLTFGTMMLNIIRRSIRVSRSFVPLGQSLAPKESTISTFVFVASLQEIVDKICHQQLRVVHLCSDMGLGLINGVQHANPGVSISFDQEHIRARPISQAWRDKIDNKETQRVISTDVTVLGRARGNIHHRNALKLALRRWGAGGLGQLRLVSMIHEYYVRRGGRLSMGEWNYDCIPLIGYFPSTSSLDNYHGQMKGKALQGHLGIVRFDVTFQTFIEVESDKVLNYDASIIASVPICSPPAVVVEGHLCITYEVLAVALLMGDEDFYELPPLSIDFPGKRYLGNSGPNLGRQVGYQHSTTYFAHSQVLSEHAPVGSLNRYIDSVSSFCLVQEFTEELRKDPRWRHLSGWKLKYVCVCLLFQSRLMCPLALYMENRLLLTRLPLENLISVVYCGHCQDIRMPGRRRTRPHTNTGPGSLNDLFGSFGLPANYTNSRFQYLCSLTTSKLTNICALRRASPRSTDRTKSNLIQCIVAGTSLGEELIQVAMANHANDTSQWANLHSTARNLNDGRSELLLDVNVANHSRYFDPYPPATNPTNPHTCRGYFLSLSRHPTVKHGVCFLGIALAFSFVKEYVVNDPAISRIDTQVRTVQGAAVNGFDNKLAVINYFAGRSGTALFCGLPQGVVPSVQSFTPDGGEENDPVLLRANVSALFRNYALTLHSFHKDSAVASTIVFHGRRLAICRFVGDLPGGNHESEFHCIDSRVVEFNDGNVAMSGLTRTVCIGIEALTSYLDHQWRLNIGARYQTERHEVETLIVHRENSVRPKVGIYGDELVATDDDDTQSDVDVYLGIPIQDCIQFNITLFDGDNEQDGDPQQAVQPRPPPPPPPPEAPPPPPPEAPPPPPRPTPPPPEAPPSPPPEEPPSPPPEAPPSPPPEAPPPPLVPLVPAQPRWSPPTARPRNEQRPGDQQHHGHHPTDVYNPDSVFLFGEGFDENGDGYEQQGRRSDLVRLSFLGDNAVAQEEATEEAPEEAEDDAQEEAQEGQSNPSYGTQESGRLSIVPAVFEENQGLNVDESDPSGLSIFEAVIPPAPGDNPTRDGDESEESSEESNIIPPPPPDDDLSSVSATDPPPPGDNSTADEDDDEQSTLPEGNRLLPSNGSPHPWPEPPEEWKKCVSGIVNCRNVQSMGTEFEGESILMFACRLCKKVDPNCTVAPPSFFDPRRGFENNVCTFHPERGLNATCLHDFRVQKHWSPQLLDAVVGIHAIEHHRVFDENLTHFVSAKTMSAVADGMDGDHFHWDTDIRETVCALLNHETAHCCVTTPELPAGNSIDLFLESNVEYRYIFLPVISETIGGITCCFLLDMQDSIVWLFFPGIRTRANIVRRTQCARLRRIIRDVVSDTTKLEWSEDDISTATKYSNGDVSAVVGLLATFAARRLSVIEIINTFVKVETTDIRDFRVYAAASLLHNTPAPWSLPPLGGEVGERKLEILDLVEGESLWQEHLAGDRECFICYTTDDVNAVSDHHACRHTMCIPCCGKWLGSTNFHQKHCKDELLMVGKCPLCKNVGCWVDILTRDNIPPLLLTGEIIAAPEGTPLPHRLWGWHRRNKHTRAAYTSPMFDQSEFLGMAQSLGKLRYTEWQYAGTVGDRRVLAEYFDRMSVESIACDGCGEDPTDHRKVCGGRACDCRLCLRCVHELLFDETTNEYKKRAICQAHERLNRWELLNDTSQHEVWAEVYLRDHYPDGELPSYGLL